MTKTLKKFFIPHAGNNYLPHILRPKRIALYSALFAAMKVIVVVFVLLLPAEVFVLPDVLAEQQRKIVELTNFVRWQKGLPTLATAVKLYSSSQAKVEDMAENEYFSHVGPNNRSLSFFLNQAGYRYVFAGENLAMGFLDAESVVNAWMKSPTHYANLIDGDFKELGIGMQSGYYNGQPTVYVAQHFGLPVEAQVLPQGRNGETASPGVEIVPRRVSYRVRGEPVGTQVKAEVVPLAVFDPQHSWVAWEEADNATRLTVTARISGPVQTAVVNIQSYSIELHRQAEGVYVGELAIPERSDALFQPIIIPTIKITEPGGEMVQEGIPWKSVKVVEKTPFAKYLQAKKLLAPLTNLFSLSRTIYTAFLVFFSLALFVSILIEIRKQHYNVIVQTLLMIGFLAWFIYI